MIHRYLFTSIDFIQDSATTAIAGEAVCGRTRDIEYPAVAEVTAAHQRERRHSSVGGRRRTFAPPYPSEGTSLAADILRLAEGRLVG